ncbi:MAG: AIR carboxylase family protein [bacterium]|nr:AIR carboxylase family protein [bacterium]
MKIRILVIVGSKSDLPQCKDGLAELTKQVSQGLAEVTVLVMSCHRHTEKLLARLRMVSATDSVDFIIAAAGKAAALPGVADSYLRYELKNDKVRVIGVAFTSGNDNTDNLAAALSITQVPGTQVIFAGQGPEGFLFACLMARGDIPLPSIIIPEAPPSLDLSLAEALQMATAK